ncbi:MAG: hypothetical protein ACI3XA_10230 [Clostridia bacterium]
MIRNRVDLKSLNSFGICKAYVDENSVSIKVYGVSGCLKVWLTGDKTVELGNVVDGSLKKEIDTSPFEGILITQSGRQMFYGKFREDDKTEVQQQPSSSPKAEIFNFKDGYNWREITTKEFPSENLSVRYILSHKCFYSAFLLHGRYFYGTKENRCAVAIECNIKSEPHPFLHLSAYSTYKDGYMIVCVNTENKTFCSYE